MAFMEQQIAFDFWIELETDFGTVYLPFSDCAGEHAIAHRNAMDTLSAIKHYGLHIRKMPEIKVSVYSASSFDRFKAAGESVEMIKWNGRDMCRVTHVPDHAGWWMCKRDNSTSSRIEWSIKTDNAAPTLEESVSLFLKSIEVQ